MCHFLRIVVLRLWRVVTITALFSVIVYFIDGFLTALGVGVLGFIGTLYSAQDLLLYYPYDPPNSRTFVLQPSHVQLPFDSVKITSKDGFKLHMFFIKQANDSHNFPTMLFFHGNAGNMGQRLFNVSGYYHKLNINILMVEYRGYGKSEGAPNEQGLYKDAQSAMDYLLQRPDIDPKKIIVFGRSLGGAIAIDLASRVDYRTKIWALIVENTFTSIPDMANIVLKWPCLRWLPGWVHKNKFPSLTKIGLVTTPTLLICGLRDLLVPPSMTTDLHERCAAVVKKLVVIPGGAHDDTWTFHEYYPALQQFLATVPALPHEDGPFFDGPPSPSGAVHTV